MEGKTTGGEVMEVTGGSAGTGSRKGAQALQRRRPRRPGRPRRRHRNPGASGREGVAHGRAARGAFGGAWEAARGRGRVENSGKVAEWIEHKSGKAASKQRGWEYLRKLAPQPEGPKAPPPQGRREREQEAFKKGSR